MFSPIAALLFMLGPAPDDKDELLAAANKAAQAKSYSFRGETKLVLPEGLDKSGGNEAVRFEGKFDRETGARVKTDSYEFVMAGGKTAARPVGEWKALKEEEGGDVQRLLYQALSGSRPPRAPHEDFAAWPRAIAGVKRADGKESIGDRECRVYEIKFTPESARELVRVLFPMGRWIDRMPIDNNSCSATARAWVDADGRILKVETSAKVTTSIQGSDAVFSVTRTTSISDVDATKVEIPEAARKALDAK
jgi:hypothetical protein